MKKAATWIEIGTCSIIGKAVPVVGEIVEVRYLYATDAPRLYQARLLGRRDDVGLEACLLSQLRFKQGVNVEAA
jgi:hypothetical protein